jgi:hypothetical protein
MEQQTINYEKWKKEQDQKEAAFKELPLSEKLPKTVEKMINIVRGRTGGSEVYADMLLSMLPNSTHKVCLSHWCYKADSDDEQTILELMQDYSMIWDYEELVRPYVAELEEFVK